ncbi:hypothetical protein [Sabulibacter ruber]|uniref:hypothetical protein n=1 Tax=Sabulibacter ruber TaxID=2811901 RepID=UPI001A95D95A|nr:hypothetical protein [Sabulibacter ruber]
MNDNSNSLKDLIPVFGVFAVAIGLIKIYCFYINFNINITDYLEISEVLTLFFDSLLLIGFGFVFGFIAQILNIGLMGSQFQQSDNNEYLKEKNVFRRYLNYFKNKKKVLLISLFLIILISAPYAIVSGHLHSLKYTVLMVLSPFFIMFVLNELDYVYSSFTGLNLEKSVKFYVIILSVVTCYVVLNSKEEAIVTNENKGLFSIELGFEKEVLKSNDSVFYVGRTKNYFIFYNSILKQSEVYSSKDLKFVKIKNKPVHSSGHPESVTIYSSK